MVQTQAQLDLLQRYYREQQAVFASNEQKTRNLLQVGVTDASPDLNGAALAAMTGAASLVMNSPDAYTVR
jgi:hypothetical protein